MVICYRSHRKHSLTLIFIFFHRSFHFQSFHIIYLFTVLIVHNLLPPLRTVLSNRNRNRIQATHVILNTLIATFKNNWKETSEFNFNNISDLTHYITSTCNQYFWIIEIFNILFVCILNLQIPVCFTLQHISSGQ